MTPYKLELPISLVSLNQLLRMHYRERKRLKKTYMEELMAAYANQIPGAFEGEKRSVIITVRRPQLLDSDNLKLGGLKILLDAMKEMRLIFDDNKKHLHLELNEIKGSPPAVKIIINVPEFVETYKAPFKRGRSYAE